METDNVIQKMTALKLLLLKVEKVPSIFMTCNLLSYLHMIKFHFGVAPTMIHVRILRGHEVTDDNKDMSK